MPVWSLPSLRAALDVAAVPGPRGADRLLVCNRQGKTVLLSSAGRQLARLALPAEVTLLAAGTAGPGGEPLVLGWTNWGNRVFAYDLRGRHRWTYRGSEGVDWVSPAAHGEVLVGYNGGGGLHLLTGGGRRRWRSGLYGNCWNAAYARTGPRGGLRLTTAADGAVHGFDARGAERLTIKREDYLSSVAAGDLDGDGVDEIVALGESADAGGTGLFVFNHRGRLRWRRPVTADDLSWRDKHLAVVHPAPGQSVVAISTEAGSVHLFDAGGKPLPLANAGVTVRSLCALDLDPAHQALVLCTDAGVTAYRIRIPPQSEQPTTGSEAPGHGASEPQLRPEDQALAVAGMRGLKEARTQVFAGAAGAKGLPSRSNELEQKVAAEPENLQLRAELLGYYLLAGFDRTHREARHRQIFWVIAHHPDSSIATGAYTYLQPRLDDAAIPEAERLWREQITKRAAEPRVLSNAAEFFARKDPLLAESLLKRAAELEPANPEWPRQLAGMYRLRHRAFAARGAAAALDEYEKYLRLAGETRPGPAEWVAMAEAAFAAGNFPKATDWALRGLRLTSRYDRGEVADEIHHGCNLLGRLALRDGQPALARAYLLAAGRVPSSAVLGSFGPDMTLAKRLLEQGDRAAVLRYLTLCEQLSWRNDRLKEWKQQIIDGKEPLFENVTED